VVRCGGERLVDVQELQQNWLQLSLLAVCTEMEMFIGWVSTTVSTHPLHC
jgi:hypothetical protein